jgi:hypothetical protein
MEMWGRLNGSEKIWFCLALAIAGVTGIAMLLRTFAPDSWIYKQEFEVSSLIVREVEGFPRRARPHSRERGIGHVDAKVRLETFRRMPML